MKTPEALQLQQLNLAWMQCEAKRERLGEEKKGDKEEEKQTDTEQQNRREQQQQSLFWFCEFA